MQRNMKRVLSENDFNEMYNEVINFCNLGDELLLVGVVCKVMSFRDRIDPVAVAQAEQLDIELQLTERNLPVIDCVYRNSNGDIVQVDIEYFDLHAVEVLY